MSMNPKNILNLLCNSFDQPQYDIKTIITNEERSFASQLEELIKNAVDNYTFMESYTTLHFVDENAIFDPVAIEEDVEDEYEETKDNKKIKIDVDLHYKQKAVEFWRSGKKKFETVKRKYRKVTQKALLYRWEAQIVEHGTRNEKLFEISKYVLDEFQNALDKSVPIHNLDIKRWALKARNDYNLSQHLFTASSKWIYNFKRRHCIVSRKINKFITQSQIANKEELRRNANEFVEKVKSKIALIGEDNVYNSDQSGFNLEMHAGRTLSFKGTLKVETLAQSLNSLTHSYTIQPIISASGHLMSPLFIVLKEKDGKFGPKIEKDLYKANNILVSASTSGKLTSELAIRWFEQIYLPNTNEKSVLCLDSWTGQNEKKFSTIDKRGKEVNILRIPAGTTGMIQPLDVYTFRPWKNFLKHFSDVVILYNYDINLHLRNNILKIQSLIHNQFSSPRFVNLFRYAWYKSGYIEEKPPKCETPVNFCFTNCETICDCCHDIAIFRCAWCTKSMCIQCFFDPNNSGSPHYCTNYKQ